VDLASVDGVGAGRAVSQLKGRPRPHPDRGCLSSRFLKPLMDLPDGTEDRSSPFPAGGRRPDFACWNPDGHNLVYVSDEEGTNDLRIIAAEGGRPIRLTIDDENHELSPAVSPDGSRIAFVSNHAGPTTLYTVDVAGGRRSAWRAVAVTSRRPVAETGRIRLRLLGPDGALMPARVYVDASDGRSYSPEGAFHRSMMVFDRHYFHTWGEDEVELPAGRARVEALRGFEYRPTSTDVDVPAGGTTAITLHLDRAVDAPARGWYSGDTHLHDLHQGRYGLTHETFFLQILAEDIRLAFPLIHMDGTRLMGRWEDLTGRPHPLSTRDHILLNSQEFRGGLGHVSMLGVREFILPFTAGAASTAFAQQSMDLEYIDRARAQGGIAGFVHPYLRLPDEPRSAASTLIAVNMALGRGDFYDVAALWSDELGSADFYYRLLNAGFRIPATGGTDNFSDVWRDPPAGSGRTYVQVDGPLSAQSWMDGIRAGRTFATTGPLLFLEVEGHGPGGEIALTAGASPAMEVQVEAASVAPLDSLQILVNGKVVRTVHMTDPLRIVHRESIPVPEGGWVAARVLGPPSPYIGDDYAFAQTSPVYVVRDGRTYRSPDDLRFLAETVEAIRARVEINPRWRSPADRDAYYSVLDEARTVYQRLLSEAERDEDE